MRAMRYMINLKEGKIPEISIYIDQNKRRFFVFINQINGPMLMSLETGQSRMDLIDKSSAQVFDISIDNFVVMDLVDSLNNCLNDTNVLWKRYMSTPKAPSAEQIKPSVPDRAINDNEPLDAYKKAPANKKEAPVQ